MTEMSQGSRGSQLDRRTLLQGVAFGTLIAALPGDALGQLPAQRPNILFILADDLGYADLSCYGRRDYETPVLDRLAADGLLFSQAYSSSPICSPTRVALITGRYHQRLAVGLPEPIRGTEAGLGLPPAHLTLPGMLKSVGYRTSLVGKWHMGWPPENGPLQNGYDSFFGIAPGAADYFTHAFGDPAENVLFEGDERVEQDGYLTELLAERAVSEIRQTATRGRPFMMSLHFTAPHWPWEGPSDRAVSASIRPTVRGLRHHDGGSLETYAEMVLSMDAAIGRVLTEIERLGLSDDTIVVFTSDNGGERYSDMWPHRGGKGDLLEGGIRVPQIVRWPNRIRPGSRTEQVMVSMDWLPTLAAATGGALDSAIPPDGTNLLEVMTGAAPIESRKLFWRFREQAQAAVRDGDWKYLRMNGEEALYDLERDPRERANRREHQVSTFERLRNEFNDWNAGMLAYSPEPASPRSE